MSEFNEPWADRRPGDEFVDVTCVYDSVGVIARVNVRRIDMFKDWASYKAEAQRLQSRIIACINACRGIPTETLASIPDDKLTLIRVTFKAVTRKYTPEEVAQQEADADRMLRELEEESKALERLREAVSLLRLRCPGCAQGWPWDEVQSGHRPNSRDWVSCRLTPDERAFLIGVSGEVSS